MMNRLQGWGGGQLFCGSWEDKVERNGNSGIWFFPLEARNYFFVLHKPTVDSKLLKSI